MGGNAVCDFIVFGRIAGTSAANNAMEIGLQSEAEAAAPAASGDAVTETGSYNGIDGPVVVQVTADATTIYDVQILEQNETVGIGSVAVEKLPAAIVEIGRASCRERV